MNSLPSENSIWELRFSDGRGASLFTDIDVTDEIGQAGRTRHITVASTVFEGKTLADVRRCFEEGDVREVVAHMGSVAYAMRHQV
jgi:hypothetical protein